MGLWHLLFILLLFRGGFLGYSNLAWSSPSEEDFFSTETMTFSGSTTGITDFENEPSTLVGGCVNVISGDFIDVENDITLPGCQPLVIQRAYRSSDGSRGALLNGWHLNHQGTIQIEKEFSQGKTSYKLDFLGSCGEELEFLATKKGHKDKKHYSLSPEMYKHGLCNCVGGEISGQTNLKNLKILYDHHWDFPCQMYFGDGQKLLFSRKKRVDGLEFVLGKREFFNGYFFDYGYDQYHRLEKIHLFDPSKRVVNGVRLSYPKAKHKWKTPIIHLEASDGRKVEYHFKKFSDRTDFRNAPRFSLTYVKRPEAPPVSYKYETVSSPVGKFERVTHKDWGDGRLLEVNYYHLDLNSMPRTSVRIYDENDPILHRVKMLKTPSGSGGEQQVIHQFSYHFPHGAEGDGCTQVYNALGVRRDYFFSREKRLDAIVRYDLSGNVKTKEKFSWEDGQLQERRLEDTTFANLCTKSFVYDDRGNIVEVRETGNFSGQGEESLVKIAKFTSAPYNLILEEEDGTKKVRYVYSEDKKFLLAKYLVAREQILMRRFYRYDKEGNVIWEVVDDGHHESESDLSGVTLRHIREIQRTTKRPYHLPVVVSEKCWDPQTNQELLMRKWKNHYNSLGRLVEQEHYDSNGIFSFSLFWEYDERGRVILEKDALGRTLQHQFDQQGNLIYEQGVRSDFACEFVYDLANRLTSKKEIHPEGIYSTYYQYDAVGNCMAMIDPNGNQTKYRYDEVGHKIATEYPPIPNVDGQLETALEHIEYDALGFPSRFTTLSGYTTTQKNTLHGKPYEKTFPDGSKEMFTYNSHGQLISKLASNSVRTDYIRDYQDRIVSEEVYDREGALLRHLSATYNAFHLTSKTDANGQITEFVYDPFGRIEREKCGEHLTAYHYDPLGRKSKVIEYSSENEATVYAFEYDLLGRVVEERIEGLDGKVWRRKGKHYDSAGNCFQEITDFEGGLSIVQREYDSHNSLVKIIDPSGNVTHFKKVYGFSNEFGQKVLKEEIVDPNGNIDTLVYNARGMSTHIERADINGALIQRRHQWYDQEGNMIRLAEAVIQNGEIHGDYVVEWKFDERQNIVARIVGLGTAEQKVFKYGYDSLGQKLFEEKSDGGRIEFKYDALGRMIEQRSLDRTVHQTFHYNEVNQVVRVDDQVHHTVTHRQFDSLGRMTEETLGNGRKMQYSYDRRGRAISMTLPDQSRVDYTYNPVSLKEVARIDSRGQSCYKHTYLEESKAGHVLCEQMLGDAGQVRYEYRPEGEKIRTTHPKWEEHVEHFDPSGNVTARSFTDALGKEHVSYAYDPLHQLTLEKGASTHSYHYDSLYNRSEGDSVPTTVNRLNQLLRRKGTQYRYDPNGNLVEVLQGKKKMTLSYDVFNRLIGMEKDQTCVQFQYDDQHRCLKKISTKGDKTTETAFLYQGMHEVGSMQSEGRIDEFFLMGRGNGIAVSFEFKGQPFAPIYDHRGHVVCLLDSRGNVAECYRYSSFGEESIFDSMGKKLPTSFVGNPWRYACKRKDKDLGWINFGWRYYNPETGRWVTTDPIGSVDCLNLYAYVRNNPEKYRDVHGLMTHSHWCRIRSCLETCVGAMKVGADHVREGIHAVGRSIEQCGRHWIPVPLVKDAVCFTGHCLTGKPAGEYQMSFRETHSYAGVFEAEAIYGNTAHIFVNGILNSEANCQNYAREISEAFGGMQIDYCYNASHGFLSDIGECLAQILGIRTSSVDCLVSLLKEKMECLGGTSGGGKILITAHSQGGLITKNAMRCFSNEEKRMFLIHTYGTAGIIMPGTYGEMTNHVVSSDVVPSIGDPIHYLKGIVGRENHLHMVDPRERAGIEHSLSGPTYRQILSNVGEQFLKAGGRLW